MAFQAAFVLGLASAQRFYAPAVQPVYQPALQANAGFAPRPMVVDTIPQPVLMDTTQDTRSNPAFAVLAASSAGFVGYSIAMAFGGGKAAGKAKAAPRAAPKKVAPKRSSSSVPSSVKAKARKAAGPSGFRPVGGTGNAIIPAGVSRGAFGSTAISPGDIGTTKPLGVYDPLQLMSKFPDKYRRYQELEIKHGRFAMAACLHVFVTEAGLRWPGYLSLAEDIKFSDMPGGTIGSWAAMPNLAWAQIVLIIALLDNSVAAQDPSKAPGDVGGPLWVRYEDKPGVGGKEFKLNAERNNGRAAMMGITGMIIHEGLTGNPLFPIPVGEQPILLDALDDIEKGPARVGSFVLAALGMVFCGAIASIPEFGKREAKA
jgi:light-harvesting complex I chlorophyll a/b binding protein 1